MALQRTLQKNCHTAKFQITNPPKFGCMFLQVLMEMKNYIGHYEKMEK